MPAVCRQDDALTTGHECDGTSTLAAPDQTKVYVEDKLVARKGDSTNSHNTQTGTDENGDPICTPHTASIIGSSSKVYVVDKLIARVGDAVDAGSLTSGSSKVFSG
tara:strand:+ start:724 stop:1041 length:318 start_codon:yes stop_codon:yes gene_type:complete